MRKSVVIYSEYAQSEIRNIPQLKAQAEQWLNESEVGKWLKAAGHEVEIAIANDYATDQTKLHLLSRLTEKEHVEYILRWKN